MKQPKRCLPVWTILLPIASLALLSGCATCRVWDELHEWHPGGNVPVGEIRGPEGTYTQYEYQRGYRLWEPLCGFAIFFVFPVTIAWDVATCPIQIALGYYPYGDKGKFQGSQ